MLTPERKRAVSTAMSINVGVVLLAATLVVMFSDILSDSAAEMLLIGIALLPLTQATGLFAAAAAGQGDWRSWTRVRVIPSAASVVGLVSLASTHNLTVRTAAAVALAGGALSVLPVLSYRRGFRLGRSSWRTTGPAVGYGARVWVGTITSTANQRLDQLIMIGLTTRAELGTYAIAVSIAALPSTLPHAISLVLTPEVARGQYQRLAQGLRTSLCIVALTGIPISILVHAAGDVVFGPSFDNLAELTFVLLLAAPPFAGTRMLEQALAAAGKPGAASLAQTSALVVNTVLLFSLVPAHGAMGAALASLTAYTLSFLHLLRICVKVTDLPAQAYLIPTREDGTFVAAQIARLVQRSLQAVCRRQ